jgi:hypothetical protein
MEPHWAMPAKMIVSIAARRKTVIVLVQREIQDLKAIEEMWGRRETRGTRVTKEILVLREIQDLKDIKDLKDTKVLRTYRRYWSSWTKGRDAQFRRAS